MEPIRNFAQLTEYLKKQNRRQRIVVVCANDSHTEYAISRALEEGIAEFIMVATRR
ncbi:phosphotransbutyrylase [Bacteroides pyogenes JCM 10003]|nr:phosphotransbutyrylase [Bacteroides pyogenes JCM 10003]